MTNTYKSWNFQSADFSCIAGGLHTQIKGTVTFIRNSDQVKKWHEIIADIEDEYDWPILYVIGRGWTPNEAFADACAQIDEIPDL